MIDMFHIWSGVPLNAVGMNSILLYILHETLSGQVPFCGVCNSTNDSHGIRMAMNVGAVVIWVLYAQYCHLKNFYLTV